MGVAKAKRQRVRVEILFTLSFSMPKVKSHIRTLTHSPLLCSHKGNYDFPNLVLPAEGEQKPSVYRDRDIYGI